MVRKIEIFVTVSLILIFVYYMGKLTIEYFTFGDDAQCFDVLCAQK